MDLDLVFRPIQVGHVQELDLADHERLVMAGRKPAALPDETGGMAGRRDDRGFLDNHGDEDIPPIDGKVRRDRQGQAMQPNHVLDEAIRQGQAQSALT